MTFFFYSTMACAESCRCREQNTAQMTGSALVSRPAAAAGCYANDSFVGLSGFEPEPTLDRL